MPPNNPSKMKRKLEEAEEELQLLKRQKTASRATLASAPKLSTFILLLFVGPASELITVHSELMPLATKRYIMARAREQLFCQLPNENPDIVRLYRLYLYTGKVYSMESDDRSDAGVLNGDAEWTRLAHLYLLGITIRDQSFANKVIDAIVEKVEENPEERIYPTGLASEVYHWTKAGDRLRRLVVDMHAWVGKGTGIQPPHDDSDGPPDFLLDVRRTNRVARRASYESPPWEVQLCRTYHMHSATELCAFQDAEILDLTEV